MTFDDTGAAWDGAPPAEEPQEAQPEYVLLGTDGDWHRGLADRGAERIAALPEVFLDLGGEMVWIDDRPAHTPRMAHVAPAKVPDLLGRANTVTKKYTSKGERYCVPPAVLCETIVSRRPEGAPWKVFDGFASGPYLLPSGEVVYEQGYRPEQRLWLPHRGSCPLREGGKGGLRKHGLTDPDEARKALLWVTSELSEFPFADPEIDRAVWLAYLLTHLTRPGYAHAPLFLFEASQPGSGKDLLFKLAEIVAHNRIASRIDLGDNPEENRKTIGAAINSGYTSLILGDVTHLGSPQILALVTEGETTFIRILGASAPIAVPRTLMLGATANNVSLNQTDLIRRSLHLRLVPPTDRPEEAQHTKDQDQLQAHFARMRPLYLTACFNALRGYIHRKRDPETDPRGIPSGSFAAWGSLVRDCLLWAGFPDVLLTQARLRRTVPIGDEGALLQLFQAWWDLCRDQWVTASRLLTLAAQVTQTQERDDGGYETRADPARQQLADAVSALFEGKPSPKGLTMKLRKKRDAKPHLTHGRVRVEADTQNNQQVFRLAQIAE